MPTWCVVRGCKNTSRNKVDSDLSWHSFPSHDESLCTEWLVRVKGVQEAQNRQVNKHWKICSEHFEPSLIEKTLTGRKRLKKGAVPTIFDQKDIKRRRESMETHRQKMVAAEIAFMNGESITIEPEEVSQDVSEDSTETEKINGLKRVLKELKQAKKSHDTNESVSSDSETSTAVSEQGRNTVTYTHVVPIMTEKDYYETTITKLRIENEHLRYALGHERQQWAQTEKERERIATENAELKKGLTDEVQLRKGVQDELTRELIKRSKVEQELESISFNFQNLSKTPKFMHYYSGFTTEEFENFIDFLGRNTCENLSFGAGDRGKSMFQDGVDISQQRNPPGRKRSLNPKDQLLMSLCRVRLGLTCQDLGVRFQMSMAQVSRITGSFITLMKTRFVEARVWPENEQTHIHNNQWPELLKPFHQRVRALIVSMKSHLKNVARFPQHASMVAKDTPSSNVTSSQDSLECNNEDIWSKKK